MPDNKREYIPSLLSPERIGKKAKSAPDQKENTGESDTANTKVKRTRKYFFEPVNSLSKGSEGPAANTPAQSSPKDVTNATFSRSLKTSSILPSTGTGVYISPKHPHTNDHSDDCVVWDTTPRMKSKPENKDVNQKEISSQLVPSSPIQNSLQQENDSLQSLFAKYNTGLENILSETPKLQRRLSDSNSTEKSKFFDGAAQVSPTFLRSKTTVYGEKRNINNRGGFSKLDPFKKNADSHDLSTFQKFSKLINNISKTYDLEDDKQPPEENYKVADALNLPDTSDLFSDSSPKVTLNPVTVDQKSQQINNSKKELEIMPGILPNERDTSRLVKSVQITDDSDSDFSDFGDSELDLLFSKEHKSTSQTSDNSANIANNIGALPTIKKPVLKDVAKNSDDDAFSDDELDEILARVATQVPAKKQHLSTQDKSDVKNAAIFKRDMGEKVVSDQAKDEQRENSAKISFERDGFHRFQIQDILRNKYTIQGKTRDQIILTVIDRKNEITKVMIRGVYTSLAFEKNDIIHIIGENPKLVDDSASLLIWNPDILVSATSIGQTTSCGRRVILNSRFAMPGECSLPMIVGNIVHSVFQECLNKNICTQKFINQIVDEEIGANLLNIYSMGDKIQEVRDAISIHIPFIKSWFKDFYSGSTKSSSMIPIASSNERSQLRVNNVLDIEENIWSPMFGLKGKIDVTLEAKFQNDSNSGVFVTPLELKTGKREQISDIAQATLYTLLAKDRYDMDISSFLLVYSQIKKTVKHVTQMRELKSLINLRNNLSQFLRDGTRMLPPLVKQSQCDICYASEICMSINKLSENGTAAESGMKEGLYDNITLHLENPTYKEFYNYWDDLLTKEEGIMSKLKKSLWLLTSREREMNNGKAVGGLTIKDSNDQSDTQTEFLYTFERSLSSQSPSLQNSQLAKFDKVIISDEDGHFAISQGYIQAIRPSFIIVKVDRRIINSSVKLKNFDKDNNQTFQSVLHSIDYNGLSQTTQNSLQKKHYRIDKDDMFHGLALARYNLLNLFLSTGDSIRRELIVDLKPPTYMNRPLPYTLPKDVVFNSDQIKAFDKVLKTKDYSLILGMPGTGKTTVIAQIIRFLVQNGKTVLLTSYTHSAVDNILIKLKDDNIPILRVGSVARVHPDVKQFLPNFDESKKIKNYSDFLKTYMEPRVVAATCLGLNDIAFTLRREGSFDYCIVDEASQVSMPVCLGPLRLCDKFILVGDHHQLPPLVVNPEAKGLAKSLFRTLSEVYPDSVTDLSYQYRMCADVMLLSNILIYDGKLKCGSPLVANKVLPIPEPSNIEDFLITGNTTASYKWMNMILRPNNRVLFLNHDKVPANERAVGEKIENATEAELVRQIVNGLVACGVEEKSIGVMSLYRAQIRLLNRCLNTNRPNVEILTADQFQGRDKECVIISLVRSNDRNNVGDLLKDWRRVNVAITRAKSKLIILGSKSTMDSLDTLKAFMEVIETRGWMYDLPKDADKIYKFAETSRVESQISGASRKLTQTLKMDSKAIASRPIVKNIIDEITG